MNEQNNASFPFIKMPENYINLMKDIKDKTLKYLYSNFNFIYFINKEDTRSEASLYDYLKKINFIICKKCTTISKFKLIILCFEGHCLFIECIDENLIKQFIEDNISIFIDLDSTTKNNSDVKEEVSSFCSYSRFEEEIKSNLFIKQTIEPIAAYMIRRYYYPSKLFKDESFFTYKQNQKKPEKNNFSEFNPQEMLMKVENDKKEINNKHTNEYEDFYMNDFIKLRNIYSNNYSSFYLVIHIKSFYIFLMKEFTDSDVFLHEKEFVENYSNEYLTRFYGFVKENRKKIGFVYEFMSNGSLDQYEPINDIFSYMSMLRIAQGIKYLHSNSLIHRDIKPSNIFIDHNNIPYLSDFDTIRKIEGSSHEMTNNIGYIYYTSPEQFDGGNYSFPTDIFSFGQIIYFLFEKKDNLREANILNILDAIRNYQIPDECKIPKTILNIFKRCISYEAKNRPTIDEVINYFYEDANSFYYLHIPFIKKIIDDIDKQTTIQYIKEIYYLLFVYKELKDDYIKTHEIQLYLILNFIYKEETELSKIIYTIGKFYYDGEIIKQNFHIAKEYFDISAKMEYSDAIFHIGKLYSLGQGVEQNYKKAKEYYERAVKQNHSSSMNELGRFYEEGLGVETNIHKAIEYYESAIKLNDPYAFCRMAHLYQHGIGVEENIQKAFEYYTISAKQNVPESLLNLGFLYQTGVYVKIDYQKSKQFYEMAVKFKLPKAYTNLGFLYQFGQGVEQNYQKAKEYYESAESLNEPNAINNLGTMFFNGCGVEKNYEKAREYFESAEKQNFDISIYNLGIIYKKGLGVPKDYLRAKNYFERSDNLSDSLYQIGKLYYYGYGVEKDFIQAKYYFEITKDYLVKSFYRLGILYMNGFGVEKDYEKAFEYFDKASIDNYYKAYYQMGILHFYGLIQKHNYLRARDYFQISSEKILDSMYYLGLIFEEGLGIKQDISKSIEYYCHCSRNRIINYVSTPSRKPTIFQEQINKNNALPYESSILYNKFYYHSNNELGFIYLLEKKYDMAIKHFKESGLNEYAFGQNSLGLYIQFYSKKKDNAKYFYEKAIKNSRFALSEFNLGYISEKDGKFDESIEYYKKASEYENEPLIFRGQIYEDERLEKSKSFIICFTNLKLHLFYSSQKRLKDDFILKAIFRPLFLLIFHTKCYSYNYNFKTIQSENGIIITNLNDFIFNNPLFSLQDKLSDSQNSTTFGWSTIKPKSEGNLELSLSLIESKIEPKSEGNLELSLSLIESKIEPKSEGNLELSLIDQPNKYNSNKQKDKENDYKEKCNYEPNNDLLLPQIDEENSYFDFNQKIENIFDYMNKQSKFILIKNENNGPDQDINYEIAKIKMKGNSINRYLKYPKNLYDALINTFKNNQNEIKKIVEEMENIIYREPYTALFGRIGLDNSDETALKDINEDFYEGIGEANS